MTPTAGEKRKSKKKKARARARKAREFFAMRIAYLRQTGFNGKVAFFYVRVSTHFVSRSVFFLVARAFFVCRNQKRVFLVFCFLQLMKRDVRLRFTAVLPSGTSKQKKERHRCEIMDSFLNELLHLQAHAWRGTRVVLSHHHHHQRRPLSLLALNISKIY